MQNVDFEDVDELLDFLPDDERQLFIVLRQLILDNVPDITEKLSYNVPYYKRNKGIFFIWPASVLWGKKKTYTGVRFGFQQGYLLADENAYLDKGNRKQVYWKDFGNLKEIDFSVLKAYIFEAVLVDGQFKKTK